MITLGPQCVLEILNLGIFLTGYQKYNVPNQKCCNIHFQKFSMKIRCQIKNSLPGKISPFCSINSFNRATKIHHNSIPYTKLFIFALLMILCLCVYVCLCSLNDANKIILIHIQVSWSIKWDEKALCKKYRHTHYYSSIFVHITNTIKHLFFLLLFLLAVIQIFIFRKHFFFITLLNIEKLANLYFHSEQFPYSTKTFHPHNSSAFICSSAFIEISCVFKWAPGLWSQNIYNY